MQWQNAINSRKRIMILKALVVGFLKCSRKSQMATRMKKDLSQISHGAVDRGVAPTPCLDSFRGVVITVLCVQYILKIMKAKQFVVIVSMSHLSVHK